MVRSIIFACLLSFEPVFGMCESKLVDVGNEDGTYGVFSKAYDRFFSSTAQHQLRLIEANVSIPATNILDLASGTGSLSKLLSESGAKVVGIDGSRQNLAIAKSKGSDAQYEHWRFGQPIPASPHQFDAVVSLFDSLNYVESEAQLGEIFVEVRRVLRPDGKFLLDFNTAMGHQHRWNTEFNQGDSEAHVQYQSIYDPIRRVATMKVSGWVNDGAEKKVFQETHRQISLEEGAVVELLRSAGFQNIEKAQGAPDTVGRITLIAH